MADTLADWLNEKCPVTIHPDDASAISSVLATLVAGGVPSRVDVGLLSDGRLCLVGSPDDWRAGFRVWYCCFRYGRTVPVHVRWRSSRVSGETDCEAPADRFSCIANSPWAPNDTSDGFRAIYDAALAALVP